MNICMDCYGSLCLCVDDLTSDKALHNDINVNINEGSDKSGSSDDNHQFSINDSIKPGDVTGMSSGATSNMTSDVTDVLKKFHQSEDIMLSPSGKKPSNKNLCAYIAFLADWSSSVTELLAEEDSKRSTGLVRSASTEDINSHCCNSYDLHSKSDSELTNENMHLTPTTSMSYPPDSAINSKHAYSCALCRTSSFGNDTCSVDECSNQNSDWKELTSNDATTFTTHSCLSADVHGYSGHHPSFFLSDDLSAYIDDPLSSASDSCTDCSDNEHLYSDKPESGLHFGDLPQEIVQRIFAYFSTQELGLALALVCQKWHDFAMDPIHWQHLILGYERNLDTADLCRILQRTTLVKHVNLCWRNDIQPVVLQVIGSSCHQLTSLDLGFCDFVNSTFLRQLHTNVPHLTTLNLEGCDNVDSTCIMVMTSLMSQLRNLNLSHCVQLDDDDIIRISQNLLTLQSLNIDGIANVTDEAVTSLVSVHGDTLQELRVDGANLSDASVHAVALNTQLLIFTVSFAELLTDTALLSLHSMSSLKELHLKKAADFSSAAIQVGGIGCIFL